MDANEIVERAVDRRLTELRINLRDAEENLLREIEEACPGQHALTQNPNGRSSWCMACGRDRLGVKIASVEKRRYLVRYSAVEEVEAADPGEAESILWEMIMRDGDVGTFEVDT